MNQAFLPKKYASCFFLPGDARFHVKHCLFPPRKNPSYPIRMPFPSGRGREPPSGRAPASRRIMPKKKALPVPGNVPQNAVLSHLLIPVKQIKQAFCHAAFIL